MTEDPCYESTHDLVFKIKAALFCCRTFETSLLLDESISDELPYSGELYWAVWFTLKSSFCGSERMHSLSRV